jgi:ABC-2 type transport system ATP-binding protein
MDVIRTSALTKRYGAKNAVENLDMLIPQGAVYGFIGRNGAGKSTTQKMVCGLAAPSSGEIKLFGKPVDDAEARRKIGVLIENAGLYPGLTAHENMMLQGLCLGVKDLERKVSENLALVGLSDTGKKKTKHFSMGMKQRLGIGLALLGSPELLVLDEPINGLDPEGIREFRQVIARLNGERGITIFISSHILGELSRIATHYGIIDEGRLVQQISATELSEKSRDYLLIKVDEQEKACRLIKEKLSPTECSIHDDGLRVFGIGRGKTVNELLWSNGITVDEIYLHQQDLEEYFLRLMGGVQSA